MNLIIDRLRIALEEDGAAEYLKAASQMLNTGEKEVSLVKILSKKLYIQDQAQFYYDISLVVSVPDKFENTSNFPVYSEKNLKASQGKTVLSSGSNTASERPIVVGFGPAGIFAALELVERGFRPIIFERGKKLEERSADVEGFIRGRVLNPESNIQFGEGGAGAYSDGKLFSRARNSPYVDTVLDAFIRFGAPEEVAKNRDSYTGEYLKKVL